MKKFLFVRTVVLTASIFSFAGIYGQASPSNRLASLDYKARQYSGTGLLSESSDQTALMAIRARNSKMYNDFSSAFPNASNIRLSSDKKETRISCTIDSVLTKIDYNKKGKWMYTIRYYGAERLPGDIHNIVKDGYPRYNLYGFVAEVSVPGKSVYLVMIEDQTSWKRIRIADGEMDAFEEYQKP
jgi:hypothetical protein